MPAVYGVKLTPRHSGSGGRVVAIQMCSAQTSRSSDGL